MQWVRCVDMIIMLAAYPVYPDGLCRLYYLAMFSVYDGYPGWLCWLF